MPRKCFECNKKLGNTFIKAEPNRHLTSPNSINRWTNNKDEQYYRYFCNEECKKKTEKACYRWFAELDRNASDSECFVHDHWEREMRVGKCKITGKEVKVEPLQPGDNSGQPKECYDHFILRKQYA